MSTATWENDFLSASAVAADPVDVARPDRSEIDAAADFVASAWE
ncbi:hypothetical protein [Methylobacterium brachiatum]|nr:hypothetical protein [Methylobacterium brachiatum]